MHSKNGTLPPSPSFSLPLNDFFFRAVVVTKTREVSLSLSLSLSLSVAQSKSIKVVCCITRRYTLERADMCAASCRITTPSLCEVSLALSLSLSLSLSGVLGGSLDSPHLSSRYCATIEILAKHLTILPKILPKHLTIHILPNHTV